MVVGVFHLIAARDLLDRPWWWEAAGPLFGHCAETSKKKRPQEARPEAASFESGVRVSVVPAFHRSEVERPPRTTDSVRDND